MIDLKPLLGSEEDPGIQVSFKLFTTKGRERWLLEDHYRHPWHLETWPRANCRAHIIYYTAILLGKLGIHLPSRRIILNISKYSIYEMYRLEFDKLSVFLGTPGINRKFVVFAKNKKGSWFIKIPISDRSNELLRNEALALEDLTNDLAFASLVPRHFWVKNTLAIEDVRQSGASFAQLDNDEILRVHNLLFLRSHHTVTLKHFKTVWEHTPQNSHANKELRVLIHKTRSAAYDHIQHLNQDMTFECYQAHGDFTRWNVLRAKDGSARIIDWEMYGRRPKFFDPLHYIVSQAILVDKVSADVILEKVLKFGLIIKADLLFPIYFGLYLVHQALMYCDLYESDDDIAPQVYWQLQKWTNLFALMAPSSFNE
jgi:thiamine kinase-like enzyme